MKGEGAAVQAFKGVEYEVRERECGVWRSKKCCVGEGVAREEDECGESEGVVAF